jgi:hypothetical protein
MSLKPPSKQTLKKYGLSLDDWTAILDRQGWCCAICKKVPSTGRTIIEHEHCKGWKRMPPDQRKRYVRGVTCWTCNTQYLGRGITIEKARNVVAFLEAHGRRFSGKPANDPPTYSDLTDKCPCVGGTWCATCLGVE